jgi:hypothetical protein
MITFKKYILNEGGLFRSSLKNIHMIDLPMFSLFYDKTLGGTFNMFASTMDDELRNIFQQARTRIQKMGFPSMHVNVVFKNLNKAAEMRVRKTRTVGIAHGNPKYRKKFKEDGGKTSLRYMELDADFIYDLDDPSEYERLISAIVHEWAHLWMFQNTKTFRSAVMTFYNDLYKQYDPSTNSIKFILDKQTKDNVAKLVNWTKGYGMGSDDELWATALETFMDLPIQHRKSILNLMQIR